MGSFSWCRAEATTRRSNLTTGDRYRILIPKEFGGGYIQDIYYDYGYVFWYLGKDRYDQSYLKYVDGNGKVYPASDFKEADIDLYGILAWWNKPEKLDFLVPCDVPDNDLEDAERRRPKTMYDILLRGCCEYNRFVGIDIGGNNKKVDRLRYPLKLVSASYRKTYEQCPGRSYDDPNQGYFKAYWTYDDYDRIRKKLET